MEDAVALLLHAHNEADESAACASLLRLCRGSDQQRMVLLLAVQPPALLPSSSSSSPPSPSLFSSVLDEFLLYFVLRSFMKAPPSQGSDLAKSSASGDSLAGCIPYWNSRAVRGEELTGHLESLNRVLLQCEWNADALSTLCHVITLLQEPCLRQSALQFTFKIIKNTLKQSSVRSSKAPLLPLQATDATRNTTQQLHEKCTELMLLGVTDVWSAIRKECARKTAKLALELSSMDAIDSFIDRLLRIAVGLEHVGNRSVKTHQTLWGELDGALYTLSLLLKSIRAVKQIGLADDLHSSEASSSKVTSQVASDIKGGIAAASGSTAAPAICFQFGTRHPSVARLPKSLLQSLKSVLYQCLRHEQLFVRANAAQCLKHYVDLCEEPMKLLIFQEVTSKLNRMKESTNSSGVAEGGHEQELLEAYEAEGLLDVLAKLAPSLPSAFLLKHWKFVFPTLERYVVHIASSVRQKSSAVVLALAKLSQTSSRTTTNAHAVELLMEMMLGLSGDQRLGSSDEATTSFCWQQKEGRLLSIDALVSLLGKDLLFVRYGTTMLVSEEQHEAKQKQMRVPKSEGDLVWATSSASLATWTLDEDDLAELSALAGKKQDSTTRQPLVSSLSAFLTEKKAKDAHSLGPSEFWRRVLRGWLQQTQVIFASNQFELQRISRQVLSGLLRLGMWTNQLEMMQSQEIIIIRAESDESWRWSCVKFVLLHAQYLTEAFTQMGNTAGEDSELTRTIEFGLQAGWSLVDSKTTSSSHSVDQSGGSAYDTETTIVKVEAQLMAFLSFGHSEDRAECVRRLLESGLSSVHTNLPSHMQLKQYATPGRSSGDTSVDRQLSISLVRLLSSIVVRLNTLVANQNFQEDSVWTDGNWTACWLILERAALAWLATDDMFRWITVDQSEAQLSLLKTLDRLLQCVPSPRSESSNIEAEFELVLKQLETVLSTGKSQRQRMKDSTYSLALNICLSMWSNASKDSATSVRCCQSIVRWYSLLTAVGNHPLPLTNPKSSSTQCEVSSWDDWDGDDDGEGNEHESSEFGNNEASEVRATASAADELQSELSGADQVLARAVSNWKREQLHTLHSSIESVEAEGALVKEQPQKQALLRSIDNLRGLTMHGKHQVFHFALGPPACDDDSDDEGNMAATINDSATSNSTRRVSRSAKRQRVGCSAAATTARAPSKDRAIAHVRIVELIQELQDTSDHDNTTHYGLFIWPSAMVLAHFVARYRSSLVRQKVVMEIGCGTGLPGILAAVCGYPKAVFLTDRSDAIDIQRNVEANIALNGVEGIARFLALDWGQMALSEELLSMFQTVDVLLAADCFYQSEDFEKVIASVALIFRCNPKCKLYVTYQLRSITRSIAPLLARWRMQANALDTAAFLPEDKRIDGDSVDSSGDEVERIREQRQKGFESVFLYEIASLQ